MMMDNMSEITQRVADRQAEADDNFVAGQKMQKEIVRQQALEFASRLRDVTTSDEFLKAARAIEAYLGGE
jgi:hypothetical protein